jgi:ATP-dependent DNA helicase RecG
MIFKRKEINEKNTSLNISLKTSLKILDMIIANNEITLAEIAQTLKISERAVKYQINSLKKKGKLKRIGPDKGGHWKIVK